MVEDEADEAATEVDNGLPERNRSCRHFEILAHVPVDSRKMNAHRLKKQGHHGSVVLARRKPSSSFRVSLCLLDHERKFSCTYAQIDDFSMSFECDTRMKPLPFHITSSPSIMQ